MVSSTEKELKRRLGAVIKGDAADQYASWQPPAMEGRIVNTNNLDPTDPVTTGSASVQSLEEQSKQAYDKGFQQGLHEGKQAALDQQQAKLGQMDALIKAIRSKSEDFDQKITEQLVEMTTLIAKYVIRKELITSSDAIITVVQEVISMMPAYSENMVLRVHPEDAMIIRDTFELDEKHEVSWKIFEDPSIQPGGCILSSDNSEINAELEQRIETVVNRVLGPAKSDDE